MEKYARYSREDSDRQRIDLHKNFRSRKEVIDSVNTIFMRIMGKELGGVSYDEEAALYQGAEFPVPEKEEQEERSSQKEGTSELLTLQEEDAGRTSPYETEYLLIGQDEESKVSAREQEAKVVAEKIHSLYASLRVLDKETGRCRPVRYRDMVILLRTTSGWAEDFKKVLEKEGIPAYVASQTGYFQAVEIKVLLQLLKVLDNPLQDIPLYGTMKSYFGGFTDEEIGRIRATDRNILLYELLKEYEGEGKEKVQEFIRWVEAYRRKLPYTPIHKLLQDILTTTGYLDHVTARPGGSQRRANVEMLLTRAAAFENTSYYGLFHFLRYVEQLEKYEVDYGEADVLDENADVVRIMSIHKSKGLEFPVCFVSGLSKRFNMQDTTGRMIADVELGIGVDYVDSERRIQGKTLKKNAVALKMKLDALGEEMRILYVAMTRAREKLILTGMCAEPGKLKEELEEQGKTYRGERVPFGELCTASCYLDFLKPCLADQRVQVIRPETLFSEKVYREVEKIDRKQRLFSGRASEEGLMTELSQRFERTYSYGYLSELFIKTTVSELKKKAIHDLPIRSIDDASMEPGGASPKMEQAFTRQLFEEQEIVPYIPSFISSEEKMSGTDRGSAYHRVMELLDFARLNEVAEEEGFREEGRKELERQLAGFVENGSLSREWRESVNEEKLAGFLNSALAARMMKAAQRGQLKREQPFVLHIPASRLSEKFPETEKVLIQGIIDAFFIENEKIILLDYKTDRVEEEQELIDRYRVQLDHYKEALEKLTGKEVSEKLIYSFALGRVVVLY